MKDSRLSVCDVGTSVREPLHLFVERAGLKSLDIRTGSAGLQ